MTNDIFTLEILEEAIRNCMDDGAGDVLMVAKQEDGWIAKINRQPCCKDWEIQTFGSKWITINDTEFYLDISNQVRNWEDYYKDWAIQAYEAL